MHISRFASDTWPTAMQPLGTAPIGVTLPATDSAPSMTARLSTGLELLLLVTMSGVVSLLLSIVAAGAI